MKRERERDREREREKEKESAREQRSYVGLLQQVPIKFSGR